MTALRTPAREAACEAILTPAMLALCALIMAAMSSYYLLLSAVPAHIATLGGDFAAGLATSTLMATTIVGELYAVRIMGRIGRGPALTFALLALAAPSLCSLSDSSFIVLLSCAVRGLGVGVLLVAAGGLAARIAPPARRAEAMGIYGVASATPAILCIPIGPWALPQWGPWPIELAAALLALAGTICIALLPRGSVIPEGVCGTNRLPALRDAAWPTASLAFGAIAIGAAVTFLPLAHRELSTGTIMLALLLQGLTSAVARWGSGRFVDHRGPQGAMVAGIALTAFATLLLAFRGDIAVIAAMVLSGVAFGVLQTASLARLLARTTARQVDGASALWNAAYDAGLGLGGFAVGVLAATSGYPAAFAITGVGVAVLALTIFQLFEAQK
ncbi:putative MFS family arabinose efflux permease [Sphingomonas sp. UYAg733]